MTALVEWVDVGAVTADAAGVTASIDDDPRRRNAPASDHRPVLAVIWPTTSATRRLATEAFFGGRATAFLLAEADAHNELA
ncbi:hypothetical protein [Rhodococcoides kyotonense]|uniref:Uncharacterized protein n=1 Tax=Rhodococcoides kyotonense TaxID=398843 RepID=A0A177YKX5_9NOCA|nr:hypothetical protein [Rhodococcus kyotonensis]OAK56242.1 hypothetical protein A3K89_17360 [Rhodococcus kyotonensis]